MHPIVEARISTIWPRPVDQDGKASSNRPPRSFQHQVHWEEEDLHSAQPTTCIMNIKQLK
jgi:hypothetical protein